jgi:hypothetical protein
MLYNFFVPEKKMDVHDDGFFHYNNNYPPLFFKPPPHQINQFSQAMVGCLNNYLKDSYKNGIKHHNTILNGGITVGEAAVLYFREQNDKRNMHKQTIDPRIEDMIIEIRELLNKKFGIDLKNFQIEEKFNEHVKIEKIQIRNFGKKILPELKKFLNEINFKCKGYTQILKQIVQDVEQKHNYN